MFDSTPDWDQVMRDRADAAYAADCAAAERVGEMHASLCDQFAAAALRGNMHAPALFAPLVNDYSQPKDSAGCYAKRRQTVGEIMTESLDYHNGPALADVLRVLVMTATGEDVQQQARALIGRMADKWAEMNLDEVMA